ncbi:hypothetical protein [Shewanella maritima]|uniref:hypothetical protein n=1 Tax=Shewanella maritima TaxID=2520507 RepID=UPI0037357258
MLANSFTYPASRTLQQVSKSLLLICLLVIAQPGSANDSYQQLTTKQTNQRHLPLGALFDATGRPIIMPKQDQLALEFESQLYLTSAEKPSQVHSSESSKPISTAKGKRNNHQNLKVANDVNCRWLNNRIHYLERQLNNNHSSHYSHYRAELVEREKEFSCLHCASTGPQEGDHHRCQYRR